MTFSAPIAFLGLLTLPLIAALHMMRARNIQYQVSSLSLWNYLTPQMRGASARQLPITWLLILDLLIATLITFTLAGPQLNLSRSVREGRHLIFLLDSSSSMAARDVSPSRFDAARADITRQIQTMGGQDAVTLIEYTSRAATVFDSRTGLIGDLFDNISELNPGGVGYNLEAALALANAAVDPDLPAEVHIFTDLAAEPAAIFETRLPVEWHLYGSSKNNQAVLTFETRQISDLRFQVFTRFANYGSQAVTRRAVLFQGDQIIGRQEILMDPARSTTYTWEITWDTSLGLTVQLEGQDDLALDDIATTGTIGIEDAFSSSLPQISIGLVSEQPGPVLRALEAIPGTNIQLIQPIDYLPGSPFDLVVFRNYLPERWPGGSILILDPPDNSTLLGATAREPITKQPIPGPNLMVEAIDFTGVRWASVNLPEKIPDQLDSVLTSGNIPVILHGQVGLTEIIAILAETADKTGTPSAFARHPAFPVLIANIVRNSAVVQMPPQIPVGSSIPFPPAETYPIIEITNPNGEIIRFASNRPDDWTETRTPGMYGVKILDLDNLESQFHIGINAGDLTESNIAPRYWNTQISSPPSPVAISEQPISLVPYLLGSLIVLLFVQAWISWR